MWKYYKFDHPEHGTIIARRRFWWKGVQIYLPKNCKWTPTTHSTKDMWEQLKPITKNEATLELL